MCASVALLSSDDKDRFSFSMMTSSNKKSFPRYLPFVRGIHRSPVNSPHKGQWRGALNFFFVLRLDERLSKQWWGWWYETVSRPLWRHSNVQIHPCGVSPIMITSRHGNNFRHLWGEFAGRWWIPLIIGRYGGRLMFSTTCCTTSLVSCWWLEILWCSCDVTVMITKIKSMPHFKGRFRYWFK